MQTNPAGQSICVIPAPLRAEVVLVTSCPVVTSARAVCPTTNDDDREAVDRLVRAP